MAWATNDIGVAKDGILTGTDSTAAVPSSVNQLQIGNGALGRLNGGIRSLIIYPNRLTNAELEAASVVGQKLPGLAETTNRITQQFPYNAEPYTPYALTDVTTAGQTRTIDVANGPVQTISATESFTLAAAGPGGRAGWTVLYIYNPSGTAIGVSDGANVANTVFSTVLSGVTIMVHAFWDGSRLWAPDSLQVNGDLRPT